jgi:hypothetical protein
MKITALESPASAEYICEKDIFAVVGCLLALIHLIKKIMQISYRLSQTNIYRTYRKWLAHIRYSKTLWEKLPKVFRRRALFPDVWNFTSITDYYSVVNSNEVIRIPEAYEFWRSPRRGCRPLSLSPSAVRSLENARRELALSNCRRHHFESFFNDAHVPGHEWARLIRLLPHELHPDQPLPNKIDRDPPRRD